MAEKVNELKSLLGIGEADASKDAILEFIVKSVTNRILIYCNIAELPKMLEEEMILMCIETYRQTSVGKEKVEEEMKAISRGDTSYSYKTSAEVVIEHIKNPSFLNDHRMVINKFRKMRR